MAAFILAGAWGWTYADPLISLAISATIGWGAFKIFGGSYYELMDTEFDEADRKRIKDIVKAHKEVISLHDLRTRRAGQNSFIQMHLELPPDMTLAEAHRISDEVEAEIMKGLSRCGSPDPSGPGPAGGNDPSGPQIAPDWKAAGLFAMHPPNRTDIHEAHHSIAVSRPADLVQRRIGVWRRPGREQPGLGARKDHPGPPSGTSGR
jgi:hypothetical protein